MTRKRALSSTSPYCGERGGNPHSAAPSFWKYVVPFLVSNYCFRLCYTETCFLFLFLQIFSFTSVTRTFAFSFGTMTSIANNCGNIFPTLLVLLCKAVASDRGMLLLLFWLPPEYKQAQETGSLYACKCKEVLKVERIFSSPQTPRAVQTLHHLTT